MCQNERHIRACGQQAMLATTTTSYLIEHGQNVRVHRTEAASDGIYTTSNGLSTDVFQFQSVLLCMNAQSYAQDKEDSPLSFWYRNTISIFPTSTSASSRPEWRIFIVSRPTADTSVHSQSMPELPSQENQGTCLASKESSARESP